jgi:hypothetical protein
VTKLPTDAQIGYLVRTLRTAATRKDRTGPDGTKRTLLDELEDRTLDAVRRAKTASPGHDGWSNNVGTNGPKGQRTITVPDEYGDPDSVPVTNVEGNVEGLGFDRISRDQVFEDAENAVGYLRDSVAALGAWSTRLDHLDRISTPLSRSERGGAGTCLACGNNVTGAAEDRLKRGLDPGCYTAWTRAGRPDIAVFAAERRAGAQR